MTTDLVNAYLAIAVLLGVCGLIVWIEVLDYRRDGR